MIGPCLLVKFLLSFRVLRSSRWCQERAGSFTLNDCLLDVMSVDFPHGTMAWCAVCDCHMSWLYSLTFGPRREKTCLWGFQQSEIQASLLNYRD